MLRLFSLSKTLINGSHRFRGLGLSGGAVLVQFPIDDPEGRDSFLLGDVEFPGVIEERSSLGHKLCE